MSNLEIMKKELHKAVITPLFEQGFTGKWPHFRREHEAYIELITFQISKYGGSFTVELSAVFPYIEDKNYVPWDGLSVDDIDVWNTSDRYRLKGMYDGWFYYRDLYKKRNGMFGVDYLDVTEKDADGFVPPKGYKCVQHFDAQTAQEICCCVNLQLKSGFRWLDRFVKRRLR